MKNSIHLSDFKKNVLTLLTGTTIAQLIPVIITPILTRCYTPQDFGVYSAYLSIISIFGLIASLKYELAIPLAIDGKEVNALLRLSFFIIIILGFLLFFLSNALRNYIDSYFNISSSQSFITLIIGGFLFQGIYNLLNFCRIRDESFRKIGISKVIRNLSMSLIQLASNFITYLQPIGLMVGDMIGRGCGIIALLKKNRKIEFNISVRKIIQIAKKYQKFPFYSTPAAFVNSLSIYMIPILILLIYNPIKAGYFVLGQKVIGMPINLLGHSISQVYYNKISVNIRNEEEIIELFYKTIKYLFYIGIGPSLILLFLGKYIFGFIFGDDWYNAGVFIQILSLAYLLRFAITPISQTLNILNKQNIQFYWDLSRTVLVGLVFLMSYFSKFNIYLCVILYSSVMFIMFIVQYYIIRIEVLKYEERIKKK